MAKAPNIKGHGSGGDTTGMKSPGGKALIPPKAGSGDLNSIKMKSGRISTGRAIFSRNF